MEGWVPQKNLGTSKLRRSTSNVSRKQNNANAGDKQTRLIKTSTSAPNVGNIPTKKPMTRKTTLKLKPKGYQNDEVYDIGGNESVKGAPARTELVLDDSEDNAMEESDDSSEVAPSDSQNSIGTSKILNRENWINSFKSKAANLPYLLTHRGQLERCGNFQPKQYWPMYGTFECQSCLRPWNSTICSSMIQYGYDMVQDIGEIIIKEEIGEQGCQNCETLSQDDEPKVYCLPHFDQEATDMAMNKVIKKIERTIYGIEDPNKPAWIPRHSGAQNRKRPHDSSRCKVCNSGNPCKGILGAINNAGPNNNNTKSFGYNKSGPEIKISWQLRLEGEFKPAAKIEKVKSPKVKAKRSINPTYKKQGPDSAIKMQSPNNQSTSFESFESEAESESKDESESKSESESDAESEANFGAESEAECEAESEAESVETIPLDNISENNSIKREDLRSMITDLRDDIRKQKPELDEIERRSDIISASVGIGTVEAPLEPKKEIERPEPEKVDDAFGDDDDGFDLLLSEIDTTEAVQSSSTFTILSKKTLHQSNGVPPKSTLVCQRLAK